MFKKIFDCSGYIYKLDATNFKSGQTSWTAELVSDKEEKVIETIYIENVYKELIKLNEEGLIKIYLYPERPNRIPNDNSDLIYKVIKWQKNGFDINKFYKLYPELKDKFLQISSEQPKKIQIIRNRKSFLVFFINSSAIFNQNQKKLSEQRKSKKSFLINDDDKK